MLEILMALFTRNCTTSTIILIICRLMANSKGSGLCTITDKIQTRKEEKLESTSERSGLGISIRRLEMQPVELSLPSLTPALLTIIRIFKKIFGKTLTRYPAMELTTTVMGTLTM